MAYVVDWELIICDLRRHGVHYREIGFKVGVSQSTVKEWATCGRQPRHPDGETLLQLWMVTTHQQRERAPLAYSYPSSAKA